MKAERFYWKIMEGAALSPLQRHAQFANLHKQVADEYMAAVEAVTTEMAARPVRVNEDMRTLAQVVGHIAAWEQFAILGTGDILAGVRRPRMVTSLEGYREPDGQEPAFTSIADFNAYQAERFAGWPWERIQDLALDTATTLHSLFTHPNLASAERLEETLPYRKRLQNGTMIDNITMGWNLWITVLEHEGVEHALELGMEV